DLNMTKIAKTAIGHSQMPIGFWLQILADYFGQSAKSANNQKN
ncbi:12792_t:CDS:1, partial [Funneliformis geosporum]